MEQERDKGPDQPGSEQPSESSGERTHELAVTQYLRPNGKKRAVQAPVTQEIARLGELVIERGFRFDCEELQTGHVSIDCCNDEDQITIEVCPNDESVHVAMENVVRDAAKVLGIQ